MRLTRRDGRPRKAVLLLAVTLSSTTLTGCHELYCNFLEGLTGVPLDCSHEQFPDLGDIEFPPLPPPPSLPTTTTTSVPPPTTTSTLPETTTTSTTASPGDTTTTTAAAPTTTSPPTTTTTTTTVPPGSGICAQLLQLRAQYNAQVDALAASVGNLGPFAQPFLASLERARAAGNASFNQVLAASGCTVVGA